MQKCPTRRGGWGRPPNAGPVSPASCVHVDLGLTYRTDAHRARIFPQGPPVSDNVGRTDHNLCTDKPQWTEASYSQQAALHTRCSKPASMRVSSWPSQHSYLRNAILPRLGGVAASSVAKPLGDGAGPPGVLLEAEANPSGVLWEWLAACPGILLPLHAALWMHDDDASDMCD